MTKIDLHYQLTQKLDDEKLMQGVNRAHGKYGMVYVRPTADLEALDVQYDASRLNALEVEDWLKRCGLPVVLAS